MTSHPILVTGAAGAVGHAVCNLLVAQGLPVRAMVRSADERSAALAARGIDVVVGDLTDLHAAHRAIAGCRRVYFGMSVSPSYLEATVNMAAVARHHAVEAFVNMSQMTISEMDVATTTDSPQHKLHWLAEQTLDWSGLPVVHIRPTAFLDTFFLRLSMQSVRQQDQIRLPLGRGRISPIASSDVARVVAQVLAAPADHIGKVHALTGPASLDMDAIARAFAEALGRPIAYVDVPPDPWREALEHHGGVPPHVLAHLTVMARLIRQGRYDRWTDAVERITGVPPIGIGDFVRRHADAYAAAHRPADHPNHSHGKPSR